MKANDKVDELDQLLILAKKSELAVLVKLYAEKNPLFRKEVTRYLDAKYKSAATTSNYRKLMKEAFKQTIVSGTYYHRLEETDWPAVRLKANELLEEGQKLLAVGNAAAAAGIGIQFFASLKENISEAAFEGDDEGLDTGLHGCRQAHHTGLPAPGSHCRISQGLSERAQGSWLVKTTKSPD